MPEIGRSFFYGSLKFSGVHRLGQLVVDIERRFIEGLQLQSLYGIPGSSFSGCILILNIAWNFDLVIPENGDIGLVVTSGNVHP